MQIFKSRRFMLLFITMASVLAFGATTSLAQEKEATRLKALESEVFYDKNTSLEWLAGPDKATNWYDAKKWVESLTAVAGGGWRMPTRKELETIYQKGEKYSIKPFFKTTGWWVWSGETKGSSSAWGFDYSYDPSAPFTSARGKELWFNREDSPDYVRGFAVRSRR